MATRALARAARLGLENWIIFSAAVPALILLLICLFTFALPWVPDPYLLNFGTGDAVLLAGFLSVGVAVEMEAYMQLSTYAGGRLTTWKNIILGVGVAESTVTGRHLVVIGAIWLLVALAWRILGPSSFFWGLGKRNRRLAITISYAFFFLFHLFMFGWLIPLGIGIYRVIVGL